MASSLEDLLTEDGFKARKSLMRSTTSFRAESPTVPSFPFPDRLKKDFMPRDRMRSSSDVSRHAPKGESPMSEHIRGRLRPRDRREETNMDSWFPKQEVIETGTTCEIVEVEEEEKERVKDIYSNQVYSLERGMFMNEIIDRRQGNSYKKSHVVIGRSRSFSDNNRRETKQQQVGNSEKLSSNVKTFDNNTKGQAALDEAAIQAMISILSGYIKRFLRDKEFRARVRHNCLSSLSVVEVEEEMESEMKILAKVEEAIGAIERGVEESASTRELKKAVVQLSVIAGLDSNELKDGFTSGIPNQKLSACAHLYLSVVYKLQRKDHVAAKHLLQVFCESPFLARTNLLPELWDSLFLPHLSHLNTWYNQEADSLTNTPGKLEFLTKVYDEIMDSATFEFAVYYKDWLTEGVETPPVPTIHVPSLSIRRTEKGSTSHAHSSEMANALPIQPTVSKKLYNAVFRHSSKFGPEDGRDFENSDNRVGASDGDALANGTLTCACESLKETDDDVESDQAFFSENYERLETREEKWSSTDKDQHSNGNYIESETCQEKSENTQMIKSQSQAHKKEDELTLKSQAKSQFDLQPPESELAKGRPSYAELLGLYLEKKSPSFSSIPQDFICPLTGQLFEEPVTLETGQTFERKAIKAWFDQGNTTCPVTAKNLECKQLVPFTNLVLKRIIETWKSQNLSARALDHHRIMTNAEKFMSLGGLELLLQWFGSRNLEERTHVASLLVRCVDADSGCRNKIVKEIDRKCLIELLLSKQVNARESAVLLLVELICLKRKQEVIKLLSGLIEEEGIEKTMHVLLVYLQSAPPLQKPLVAVLLLHFDLLVEPRKYSIYREEAVDAITEALFVGLNNEKIRENCRRALLILGGRFSVSGKLLTHGWILNQAGFKANAVINSSANEDKQEEEEEDCSLVYDASSLEDEEHSNEQWQRKLCASIFGNGERYFSEAISKCIGSEDMEFVTACLTTVAWLSNALASMPNTELQLRAFSFLIARLKQCLEDGLCVEHKVLASTSLLNFSKISECRVVMMSMAENITFPLKSLVEVTWTAKRLYSIISGEALQL